MYPRQEHFEPGGATDFTAAIFFKYREQKQAKMWKTRQDKDNLVL